MSIENTLERIAVALETLVKIQTGDTNAKKSKKAAPSEPELLATTQAIPVDRQPAPAVEPALVVEVAPPVLLPDPAPIVPPMPNFMGEVTPAPDCPIADQKGLLSYVMGAYTEMGPEKGGKIQDILAALGAKHLNDVKPEHYPMIYTAIENLKVS